MNNGELIERVQIALRQYRHNYAEKAVFGYDKELMDVFIERLAREKQQADQRIKELEEWNKIDETESDKLRNRIEELEHELNDARNGRLPT